MAMQPLDWNSNELAAPNQSKLENDNCELWLARVPNDDFILGDAIIHLSEGEQHRAGRFTLASARREFIFGRFTLRQILGSRLGLAPVAVPLGQGPAGKPCLAAAAASSRISFNLTHSGGLVLIALARGREVGVDVEWRPALPDWASLVPRIFSAREQAELHALPPSQKELAFFNGWTRKEAWLKATGEGLRDDLPAVEVALAPGRPPAWLALPGGPGAMRQWALREIILPAGFTGALVYDCKRHREHHWQRGA